MAENILQSKSYHFAIDIIRISEEIVRQKKEYVLSKQLLKSGTSIRAMIREAEFAQSRADFINKMSIALKEANETTYWLSLLKDTVYIAIQAFEKRSGTCKEIISILVASIKTSKSKS